MLAREDDERLVEATQIGRAEMAEGVREAAQERLRLRGELVIDGAQAVGGVDGDRALLGPVATLDVQRLPRVGGLVLREAEGILAGVPRVARSRKPGRVFITFIITSRTARPMVALARTPVRKRCCRN